MTDYQLTNTCTIIDDILSSSPRVVTADAVNDQGDDSIVGTIAWNIDNGIKLIEIVGDIIVDTGITLIDDISIFCRNQSTITVSSNADIDMFNVTGNNVTLNGIIANGDKSNQSSGSFINVAEQASSIDDLTVENCEITDFKEYGIYVRNGCINHRYINNKIDSVDKTGIIIAPETDSEVVDNIRFEGNHVISAGWNGLQVYNDTLLNNSNIFMIGNYLINVVAVPLEIQRCYRAVVSNNIIEGAGTNGISFGEMLYGSITNNVIEDQSAYGIEIACAAGSGNWVVDGNSIYNCGTGIWVGDSGFGSHAVISNNVIDTTTAQEGIEAVFISKLVISGNVVYDPYTIGIRCLGTVQATPSIHDVVIDSNVIRFDAARASNAIGIYIGGADGGRVSNNLITASVAYTQEFSGLIELNRGNKNIHIIDNSLLGTTPLDIRGIFMGYADSGNSLYVMRNIIKYMKVGIQTSSNTNPKTVISGNFFEEISSSNISAHASHKTDLVASSPTQGAMWQVGDAVWETAPTDSNPPGWICASSVNTELSAPSVVTDTTMDIDSSTGMTAGDIVGVELDDGTWHWTTVASVDSGTLITLTAGLVGDGAATNNDVVTHNWLPMAELGTVKV